MLAGALEALAFVFVTFDIRFLAGVGPRWDHPSPDLILCLASSFYYWSDAWRFPLFELPAMGYPEGGSIVYNDAIPIGALASKIVASLTGLCSRSTVRGSGCALDSRAPSSPGSRIFSAIARCWRRRPLRPSRCRCRSC